MAMTAIGEFRGVPRDSVQHFHGNQLVYIGWDRHLMFYSPVCFSVPPTLSFRDFVHGHAGALYAQHPQWAQVDWSQVQWLRSGEPFTPDMDASLAANGIGHKEIVRLRTPGLDGIGGSGS